MLVPTANLRFMPVHAKTTKRAGRLDENFFLSLNRKIIKGSCQTRRALLEEARLGVINESSSTWDSSTRNQITTWQTTPPGFVKLNVDVAYDRNSKIATMAIIARNEFADVLFSAVSKRENVASSIIGEIHAIGMGLQIA
ncbi:hypothetical protein REPUB_Repub02eG0089200 [Reevesia pubescens]